MKERVEQALKLDTLQKTHHIDQFLLSEPQRSPFFVEYAKPAAMTEEDKTVEEGKYATAVANARVKACERSDYKVTKDYTLPRTRESQLAPGLSPWLRAQVDMYHEVVRVVLAEGDIAIDDPRVHPLANVASLKPGREVREA